MAPPGNQAANGENKRQPEAMGGSGLFDKLKRIEIFRGGSIHPLYVTSAGVDLQIV
jgi:hypothetical protein